MPTCFATTPTADPGRPTRPAQGKVGLISGGGSGHEPLHGGFVGLRHARRRLPGRGLHLAGARPDARRHQGGRRRRGRAAHRQELHRRRAELPDGRRAGRRRGHRGRPVVVDDDVAVQDSHYTAGRRGIGATVFVEKIAGAPPSAATTWPRWPPSPGGSTQRARSFGVALTSCTAAGGGQADLRAGRGRDGGRHRHPRRARPAPRAARHAPPRSPT